MEPIPALAILAVITILSFLFFQPKERPPLGPAYWNSQKADANDLANMFGINNDADRLIEMLLLNPATVPNAQNYRAAAAANGIPILFQRHSIPRKVTDRIISNLIKTLDDCTWDATHALTVLGVGSHLGWMEKEVVEAFSQQLQKPSVLEDKKTVMKICDALGYIGVEQGIEPLMNINNNSVDAAVKGAALRALEKLGVSF